MLPLAASRRRRVRVLERRRRADALGEADGSRQLDRRRLRFKKKVVLALGISHPSSDDCAHTKSSVGKRTKSSAGKRTNSRVGHRTTSSVGKRTTSSTGERTKKAVLASALQAVLATGQLGI